MSGKADKKIRKMFRVEVKKEAEAGIKDYVAVLKSQYADAKSTASYWRGLTVLVSMVSIVIIALLGILLTHRGV